MKATETEQHIQFHWSIHIDGKLFPLTLWQVTSLQKWLGVSTYLELQAALRTAEELRGSAYVRGQIADAFLAYAYELANVKEQSTDFEAPSTTFTPPQFGERILLLILRTKEERVNIPGDLEEEFKEIAAKQGAGYAKIWYYKQVAASAWPMLRKAVGWGVVASLGAWLRRII